MSRFKYERPLSLEFFQERKVLLVLSAKITFCLNLALGSSMLNLSLAYRSNVCKIKGHVAVITHCRSRTLQRVNHAKQTAETFPLVQL